METEYTKIPMGQRGEMTIETNFSGASTPCKAFRVTVGKEQALITREELFGVLWLFADEKQQEDLIPVTQTRVRAITRLLKMKAKKNIRKGEEIVATYQYFVPETVYEKLLISNPEKYRPGDIINESQLEKHVNKLK